MEKSYLSLLEDIKMAYQQHGNLADREYMYVYMRQKFDYYGIKTPLRRSISKPFLSAAKILTKSQMINLVDDLWHLPQREFHHLAMDIAIPRFKKQPEIKDIHFFEILAETNSWWDTVDFIANKLMGNYFLVYPEERKYYCDKWIKSGNIWMVRCAILFQLKYKDKTDINLLFEIIRQTWHTDEFFINKAIGWILRENSKHIPETIKEFVHNNKSHLSELSRHEALRLITN